MQSPVKKRRSLARNGPPSMSCKAKNCIFSRDYLKMFPANCINEGQNSDRIALTRTFRSMRNVVDSRISVSMSTLTICPPLLKAKNIIRF